MSDTKAFAAAVRDIESAGNYGQVRGQVRQSRIVGAYGFAGDDWTQMAADAGLEGARWSDPRAQDLVAQRTFDSLWRKYRDWRLVAVAWKAGEAAADAIVEAPSLLDEPGLKEVKSYVTEVMRQARSRAAAEVGDQPEGLRADPAAFQTSLRGLSEAPGGPPEAGVALRGILVAMRNRRRNMAEGAELEPEGDRSLSAEVSDEPAQ